MNDPLLLLPLILLGIMLFLMWRGGKQRQKMMQDMRTKLVPGAEVMTQAGIFGTLVAIDEDTNVATLEVSPGTTIRVHSQTVATVVEPAVPDDASALDDIDTVDEANDVDVVETVEPAETLDDTVDPNEITDVRDDDRKNL